jgi:hypothetical protein
VRIRVGQDRGAQTVGPALVGRAPVRDTVVARWSLEKRTETSARTMY